MTLEIALQLGLLPILLLASAFFSGSENALFSLTGLKLKRLFKEKKPTAPVIAGLLDNPRRTLITILFGDMLVNIFIATISASLVLQIFGAGNLEFSIIAVTFFIIIFGEILPATLGMYHNETLATIVARPINFLGWLFAPFRLVLRLITDIITSPLTKFLVLKKYALSGDALKTIIAIGHEEGYLDNWQKIIFDGYFDLAEKTARELMVPRTEIFYVNYQDSFEELINKISDQKFSRIPVIAGSIDEIKGIIYTKEILKLRNLDESQQKNWPEIIRPAFFVPESKKADELLKELIVSGRHLALVLDEYGGLSGLITLEDLLENIFTGINKPHVTPKIKFLTPGVAVVSGNLEIKKFNRIFQAHLKDPFNETLAGFIISRMDKIPQAMENFRWDYFSFLILRGGPQNQKRKISGGIIFLF